MNSYNKFKLYLTNTLGNKKEIFNSINHKNVNMYVCGITPYDYAHLGHGRCYIFFDVLYRLLNFLNYNVSYCRNFTDIDDKLINKSQLEFNDPNQYFILADKFIKAYHDDMLKLNCLNPVYEPRVTNNISQIINFIEQLIKKNHAYVSDGDVYYNVHSFKDYGKLSRRNIDDLKVGARIKIADDKRDPLDFALWKSVKSGPGWNSPWGYGRPGWHIECSTLIKEYLSETIDIHGGGMDLIFPHHENEIAQSEVLTNKNLSNYWIHNAFILINKEKMSKSLNNFFTLRDVFERFDPMLLRYYLLLHHYRSPVEFSFDDLKASQKSYQKLVNVFQNSDYKSFINSNSKIEDLPIEENSISNRLILALLDDINISKFFGIIFENLRDLEVNYIENNIVKFLIENILGILLKPILEEKNIEITSEIEDLIKQRDKARKAKDWAKADAIRDRLKELGIELHDQKID